MYLLGGACDIFKRPNISFYRIIGSTVTFSFFWDNEWWCSGGGVIKIIIKLVLTNKGIASFSISITRNPSLSNDLLKGNIYGIRWLSSSSWFLSGQHSIHVPIASAKLNPRGNRNKNKENETSHSKQNSTYHHWILLQFTYKMVPCTTIWKEKETSCMELVIKITRSFIRKCYYLPPISRFSRGGNGNSIASSLGQHQRS